MYSEISIVVKLADTENETIRQKTNKYSELREVWCFGHTKDS